MADYKVTDTELTAVANAIRTKGGTQASLEWSTGFISAISNISNTTKRLPNAYAEVRNLLTVVSDETTIKIPITLMVGDVFTFKYGADTIPSNLILPFGIGDNQLGANDFRVNIGIDDNKKRFYCYNGSICDGDDQTIISDGDPIKYGNVITSGDITQKIKILRIDTNSNKYLRYGAYTDSYVNYTLNNFRVFECTGKRANGDVFIDCIPCVMNNPLKLGVYELISNTFYTNNFNAGLFV